MTSWRFGAVLVLAGALAPMGCGSTEHTGGGAGGAPGSGGGSSAPGGAGGGRATGGASGAIGGGGGGGGGAGQGGMLGAGGVVAINPCAARAGLRFCDDFEATAAGSAPAAASWSVINGGGVVTVDGTAPAHSGTRSVRVSPVDGGFQTFAVYHDPAVLPAPAGGKFFLRFFIRVGQAMTAHHNTLVVADLFAQPGTGNAVRLGEDAGMLMMTVAGDAHGYLSNKNYYNDGKPGVVFTPGTWSCVELSFDPAATTIDVWIDGTEVPDMHPTDIQQDRYDDLRFGFEKYAGPVSDLWYDDVAVGTERIGCN
jgi:hypothetical protein